MIISNIIRSQKFLLIFCNFFFITIKKSIQYKLIEIFSIVFYDFFPSFSFRLFHSCRLSRAFFITNIEITIFKSFKLICTRSNGHNIFTIRFTNNSVCVSNTIFFLVKTKGSGKYTLYLHF